jgi:hypothetical protein
MLLSSHCLLRPDAEWVTALIIPQNGTSDKDRNDASNASRSARENTGGHEATCWKTAQPVRTIVSGTSRFVPDWTGEDQTDAN